MGDIGHGMEEDGDRRRSWAERGWWVCARSPNHLGSAGGDDGEEEEGDVAAADAVEAAAAAADVGACDMRTGAVEQPAVDVDVGKGRIEGRGDGARAWTWG